MVELPGRLFIFGSYITVPDTLPLDYSEWMYTGSSIGNLKQRVFKKSKHAIVIVKSRENVIYCLL